MVYMISYDLNKPGQNYDELLEAIKQLGDWWHYLKSTWLVSTNLTPQQIWQRLQPKMDTSDYALIIAVTGSATGWLPKEAWDWINQRVK